MIKLKRELKNLGIKPIEELSVQEKTSIAERVAAKLVSLNVPGITHNEILEELFDAKMYTAEISNNLGKVNYFYKNKTIYFDKRLNLIELDENILRECIHYLQDKREKQKRMGLCTFEQYKVRGMALNEIGISYISNKLLNKNNHNKTFTLLKQILLITGEDVFLDSIINNNNKFQDKFMQEVNSENVYYKMQNTLDAMFDLEQITKRLDFEGRKSSNPQRYLAKINMHKHTLNSKFSEMQWDMYNRYFSRKIELIDKIEEIRQYKEELFNFNQWLEISEDEQKYSNFVAEKIEKLNRIELELIMSKSNNSMIVIGNSKFTQIMRSIKNIIFKSKQNKENTLNI